MLIISEMILEKTEVREIISEETEITSEIKSKKTVIISEILEKTACWWTGQRSDLRAGDARLLQSELKSISSHAQTHTHTHTHYNLRAAAGRISLRSDFYDGS